VQLGVLTRSIAISISCSPMKILMPSTRTAAASLSPRHTWILP
jgi:hypothetical protein